MANENAPALPVVALHSLGLDGRAFDGLKALLPDRPLLAPDLRGHASAASQHPATLTLMADDIAALVADQAAENGAVHLLGHSLGGAIAGLVAERTADQVASLTIVSTPPRGHLVFMQRADDAELRGMDAQIDETLERWFDTAAESETRRYAEACLRKLPRQTWIETWRSFAEFPGWATLRLPARLADLSLCIATANDKSTPLKAVAEIACTQPGMRFFTNRASGHMAIVSDPGAFLTALQAHWKRADDVQQRVEDHE